MSASSNSNQRPKYRARSRSRNATNTFDPHEKVIRDLMSQNESLKGDIKKCNDEKENLEKINEKTQEQIDKDKQVFIKLSKETSNCDSELFELKARIKYLEVRLDSDQKKLKLKESKKANNFGPNEKVVRELRELELSRKSRKNRQPQGEVTLKECEDSIKNIESEIKDLEFKLKNNKKDHQKSNSTLYGVLDEHNFNYIFLDHQFKDDEQTTFGEYKKSFETIHKNYNILIGFYKELIGKCKVYGIDECHISHKILRTNFNLLKIESDFNYEQRDLVNKLVHSIIARGIDENRVTRHFKDAEKANYAYYRKSYDEVKKTYKRVLDYYNELIIKCSNTYPHLGPMINLQMSEISKIVNP